MVRKRFTDLVAELLPEIEEMFPWDLADLMAAGEDVLLLDVRCPGEFQTLHIDGSLNVPRGILETACDYGYEETVPELVEARERTVAVICRSGNRSVLAAYTLRQLGYRRPISLKTGLRGWNDYEQPLVDAQGRAVSLEAADTYFVPRISPAQAGPQRQAV